MSVGLPSRGGAGPRAGTFAPRHQSRLGRAFAKGGVARSWDWLLFAVTCALTVLGPVRGWAATEPALRQAGLDPHTYLKKAILWAALGFVLMMVTACIDYRRIRRWTPVIYALSLLLLGAVLAVGQSVNGAKAWIALPGGFQVEPSEFAKLGLILSAAWLLSRQPALAGGPLSRMRGSRPPPPLAPRTSAGRPRGPAEAARPRPRRPRRRPADHPGRTRAGARRHAGARVHAGRRGRRLRHPRLLGARPGRGGR